MPGPVTPDRAAFPRRWGLAFSAAALAALSFPSPLSLSLHPWGAPLAWVALAPAFALLEGLRPNRAARWGFLFGYLMFGAIIYWIALLVEAKNLKVLGWAALTAIMACYPALFAWLLARLRPAKGPVGSLAAAALWTAVEFFRGSWPFGGFPWGQIGVAHAVSPALLYWTTWTGVWGLTFLSAYFAREAYRLWAERDDSGIRGILRRPRAQAWIGGILCLYVVGHLCCWKPTVGGRTVRVACLQPSVDQSLKWTKAYEDATYGIMERLTRTVTPLDPGLVIWPETAAPSFLRWSPNSMTRVQGIVGQSGLHTLVGCLDAEKSGNNPSDVRQYNAAIDFSGAGKPLGTYHKSHLVPFGEYVPFQKYLTFLGPVVADLGDFNAGSGPVKFEAKGFSYSPMICYEAIFPRDGRAAADTGADVLVNISNDAWYGRTAALYQHVLLCSVRSAEERRPMARAANTGICALVDPSGKITASTPWYQEEALVGELPLAQGQTLYAKWGDWFPWACVWASVLGVFAGMVGNRTEMRNLE